MVAAAAGLQGSAARSPVTYTVGDSMGWTIPPMGAAAYQGWANGKTFAVGDVLVFNLDGKQDVTELTTKYRYDSCSIFAAVTYEHAPPVRITLTTPGMHYFVSTVPEQCEAGVQLTVNAVNANTSSAAASPLPDVASPPPSTRASLPPSTGAAPSTSKTTPPPSLALGPSPPLPGNDAAGFSKSAVLSHLGAVLAIGFVQLFM